jgi:hypothetical protein
MSPALTWREVSAGDFTIAIDPTEMWQKFMIAHSKESGRSNQTLTSANKLEF